MSLSCIFRGVGPTLLLLAAVATGDRDMAISESDLGSNWNGPPTAAVFSEQKKSMPKGTTQAVELLRFVTAYKTGVEALVDITPYSALIKSTADTDGELTFFAFIDTWVGNNTDESSPVMNLDSAGKCMPGTKKHEAWGAGGTQGNGWQVDANMVFWPRTGFIDTRPRESVTISSGYYGSYSIGAITTHEGTVTRGGSSIDLKGGADLTGTIDAEVYPCPNGAKDVEHGIKMGGLANKVLADEDGPNSADAIVQDVYNDLVKDFTTVLSVVRSDTGKRQAEVNYDDETRLEPGMPVWYDYDDIVAQNGSSVNDFPSAQSIGKVATANGSRATIDITGSCMPGNVTLDKFLPRLKMERQPGALAKARSLADSWKTFKQRMAKEEHPQIISLLARERSVHRREADESPVFKPFLVGSAVTAENTNVFSPLPILGQVDLGFLQKPGADCAPPSLSFLQEDEEAWTMPGTGDKSVDKKATKVTKEVSKPWPGSATAAAARLLAKVGVSSGAASKSNMMLSDGDKVCVLARRSNGRVFERTFELPTFVPAAGAGSAAAANGARMTAMPASGTKPDRVLLQFAVTGHGWSGSTEQCGEFCHAIYHINVNGKKAADVTEWRDDCEGNPVSGQSGTWTISRDGWCPGSVEPGLYLDVTKFLKKDRNEISVDLSVWSSLQRKYLKYTNYGNYFGSGDGAVLFVGASLFIYDGTAVDAIKRQKQAYTAAEAALRDGCSSPKALQPPAEVNSAFGSLLERSETATRRTQPIESNNNEEDEKKDSLKGISFLAQQSALEARNRYNFEGRAPWYKFEEASEGLPGARVGAKVVPAFKDGLIQINSREIRVKVKAKSLPQEWGQAAMHIRLERPSTVDGLEMDNWDRVGSLGLVFEEGAKTTTDPKSMVKLRPSTGRELRTSWSLSREPML